jgi:hypothetical protein
VESLWPASPLILVTGVNGAVANSLALVEYDCALINAEHVSQLVVRELSAALFDIFSEPDPVADRERDLVPLEHAKLVRLVEW